MGSLCGMYGREGKRRAEIYVWTLRERGHFQDLSVDEGIDCVNL
jgi:hypothetical protein